MIKNYTLLSILSIMSVIISCSTKPGNEPVETTPDKASQSASGDSTTASVTVNVTLPATVPSPTGSCSVVELGSSDYSFTAGNNCTVSDSSGTYIITIDYDVTSMTFTLQSGNSTNNCWLTRFFNQSSGFIPTSGDISSSSASLTINFTNPKSSAEETFYLHGFINNNDTVYHISIDPKLQVNQGNNPPPIVK